MNRYQDCAGCGQLMFAPAQLDTADKLFCTECLAARYGGGEDHEQPALFQCGLASIPGQTRINV